MIRVVAVIACAETLTACSSTQKIAQFSPISQQKEGFTLEQVKLICKGKAEAEMEAAGRGYAYGGLIGAMNHANAREFKYYSVMKSRAAEYGYAISYIEVPK
ncbi:MAG: hypothetical protein VX907_01355 [Pseudomonadota bacterium]|nr:hypothetical protein [Pseudomonadota bacterium]